MSNQKRVKNLAELISALSLSVSVAFVVDARTVYLFSCLGSRPRAVESQSNFHAITANTAAAIKTAENVRSLGLPVR